MEDVAANEKVARSAQDLLDELRTEIGAEGYQHQLDANHSVSHIARGPKLIVSFERVADTLEHSDTGLPLCLDFADDKHWSVLHFAADGDTWFRSDAVYAFLDEMTDDGFFETFDQVLFYGTGMGAYAAAAFSVVAPGATVVAIGPQATLDHEAAEWDDRFPAARRLNFRDRYGYAPDLVEGAARAYILYDPRETLDAVHASLFRSENVTRLKCRFFRNRMVQILREIDVLHRVVEEAADGRLTATRFYRLLRARRSHGRYLRNLLFHLDDADRPGQLLLLCAHVLARKQAPAFLRRYNASYDTLADAGKLPAWATKSR